jgi:peptidoglycan-associated lipoprotein
MPLGGTAKTAMNLVKSILAAAVLVVLCSAQLLAQDTSAVEVAVTYNATRSSSVPGSNFWMEGGSVELQARFYRGLGVVADISGAHTANINTSGVGLDLVTATFGPRYTWAPAHWRYELFGQVLAGEANGFNSVFPTPSGAADSSNSLALKMGGGMNIALSRRIALRAIEANWLRTQLPNATTNVQNNLNIAAGFVFRLP